MRREVWSAVFLWRQPEDLHPWTRTHGPPRPRFSLFGGGSYSESLRIGSILREEAVGGALLVAAAVVAVVWANSPMSDSYFQLRDIRLGYPPWDLELSLGEWASDGLLAIFFFLVGQTGSVTRHVMAMSHMDVLVTPA